MIGLDSFFSFKEAEEILEIGDKIFLYTDGITELANEEGKEFGADRFYAILEKLKKESVHKIVQEVYDSLRDYNKNFQDDMSLLGIERELLL